MREIIVGKYHGRYLTLKEQGFVLLAAPTGANKGVAVMLPNLLNFPDSMAVLDIKLENFRYTSRFRQRHGQQVFLWAPFAEDGRTHCWNMLDAIPRDSLFRVGEILAIAQAFYPSDCDPKEKFWNDNARNLFLALVLYLIETPELPCTMGEVLRLSSGRGKPLKDYLQSVMAARAAEGKPLSAECCDSLHRFLSTPENTLGNVISTFTAPLLVFSNPVVDAATSRSDFQLSDLLRQRMTIYVGIQPNRLADAALLVNLFFSQLIDHNTRQLPDTDPGLRYQCLLGLDELPALGKIKILAKSNAYIRAYGLRLLTIVQSIAQLVAIYGEADARTLMTNHALQIAFAPREQSDAEEYSKYLGFNTERAVSQGSSRNRGAGHRGGSVSENISDHARPLMLPQELKAMPRHQQIIFMEATRPILCDKARYYEDHRFLDRLKATSATLAGLDQTRWRQLLHQTGMRDLAKVTPTEEQLNHVAYILEELSIDVPRLDLARHAADTAARAAAQMPQQPPAPAAAMAPTPVQPRPIPVQQRLPFIDINELGLATVPASPHSVHPSLPAPSNLPDLPRFADSKRPTAAEAEAILDAFFGPLEEGNHGPASTHAKANRQKPVKRAQKKPVPEPALAITGKTGTPLRKLRANIIAPLPAAGTRPAKHQPATSVNTPPLNLSALDE